MPENPYGLQRVFAAFTDLNNYLLGKKDAKGLEMLATAIGILVEDLNQLKLLDGKKKREPEIVKGEPC